MTKKLNHPSQKIKKIYSVTLDKDLDNENLKKIIDGIDIENEKIVVDNINILNSRKEIGIEIQTGKNRIIKKIFESLGFKIKKLDRVTFGPLTKKDLPRGKWRRLSNTEIRNLKFFNRT